MQRFFLMGWVHTINMWARTARWLLVATPLGLLCGVGPAVVLPGLGAAGFVLVALVSAATIVLTRRADWLRIALRAAGNWIAAIGLMVAVA